MANSVERYYQKKKRRKKKLKFAFFTMLFILMMLTLGILSVTVFFNAEEILVEGNTRYSAEKLLEQGGLSIGQNLFRLDKFEVIEKMEELPYVKSVTIKRKLPNTLTVKVVENEPVVWIRCEGGVALLNEEYRVLSLLNIPEEQIPAPPVLEEPKELLKEEETEEETKDNDKPKEEKEEEKAPEKEEPEAEEEPEETPVEPDPRLEKVAQLTPLKAVSVKVGRTADFGEDSENYAGFLKTLYDAFEANEDLDWADVDNVIFTARYDIQVIYKERITIDFGTLDRAETKVQLAAYLLKDNGTSQAATVDVTNVDRVRYRPKK